LTTTGADLASIWNEVLACARLQIDPDDLRDFVDRLQPVAERDRTLVLEAPSRLAVQVVQERYRRLLEGCLQEVSEARFANLVLTIRKAKQQELFAPSGGAAYEVRHSVLLPKYTFANFVVGASNQFAHAACKAVASQPGVHYNPLFIYGGVGLGKTHLVNAIGHEVLDRSPDARVLYLSSDSFMNDLIAALRRDRMEEFKNRFRRMDVLILDDVQFLARRERTQAEFFHTFNSLYESRRQIVLTSDKFPKEIPDLEERLCNRFEWGLIADIQPPDVETRVAIIEKKAEIEQIALPHDVALFLASSIDSNVRELEGSLTRLGAFASLNKCAITVDFARRVLQSVLRDRSDRAITIESIQRVVCEYYSIRQNDLRSRKRTRSVALPRQVAMYLCRQYTSASFPTIGDRFGGRDHSTVIHATRVVKNLVQTDPDFRARFERLQRLVERAG
jgi:chromosomal replication initiator protein